MIKRSVALGLSLFAAGCLGKFQTPSAYSEQRFLCDEPHSADFQNLVDGCRVDGHCFGAFSMRGSLQNEPLTVESQLSDAAFGVVQPSGASEQSLDRVQMSGTSPYFQFVFHIKSVGGVVSSTADGTQRTLELNSGAARMTNPLVDDLVDVGQFLEVGGASSDQAGMNGSVVITSLSATELRGTFHGSFGSPTDVVDGCFAALPSITTVNPTPTQ